MRACAFKTIPNECKDLVDNPSDYVVRIRKDNNTPLPKQFNLQQQDPEEEYSIYKQTLCNISDDTFDQYKEGSFLELIEKANPVELYKDGGQILTLYPEAPEPFYRLMENVLRGITVMNGAMKFHKDIHEENIVILNGTARIIDFEGSINLSGPDPDPAQVAIAQKLLMKEN